MPGIQAVRGGAAVIHSAVHYRPGQDRKVTVTGKGELLSGESSKCFQVVGWLFKYTLLMA